MTRRIHLKKYSFRATQRTFSNFIELCNKRGTKLFANWPKSDTKSCNSVRKCINSKAGFTQKSMVLGLHNVHFQKTKENFTSYIYSSSGFIL